jgi:hypothetical protein
LEACYPTMGVGTVSGKNRWLKSIWLPSGKLT